MKFSSALLSVLLGAVLVTTAFGVEMEMTAENVRNVIQDFAHELTKLQDETLKPEGRQRALLTIKDAFDSINVPTDFDFDVDLSDFINGILTTPIFDFVSELPENEEGWEKEIKEKYKQFCTDPEKDEGDILLQACQGHEISFELVPGKCEVVDKEQQKYDCEPPRLEYSRSGPACETGYEEAVTFTDKECKFVQQLGEEYHVVLGGGVKNTEIRFGKQDVEATPDFDVSEILDVIKGLFSDLIDHPESDPAPEAP